MLDVESEKTKVRKVTRRLELMRRRRYDEINQKGCDLGTSIWLVAMIFRRLHYIRLQLKATQRSPHE